MPEYSQDFLIRLYREMYRIRAFEEALINPILSGEVKTPCHLCSGQEAVAVGVCQALQPTDVVFGNHRSHGHYLAKGGDMKALAAEIWGKERGCSRGRGGSMHITAPEVGFMGATPIVAGTVALALGAALAFKIRGENRVAVSFFGDGAMGEGVIYEALNFAGLHDLPILFVCENNYYATHMPIQKCMRWNTTVTDHACGFGVPIYTVNGNKVLDVFWALRNYLRDGPFFLECNTYRLRGHVGPDDNIQAEHRDIRPPEEIEEWKAKDPIETFRQHLFDKTHDFMTEDNALRKVERESQEEVQEAIEFARTSPYPKKEELMRYVYA